jgi:hypothetical protein
MSYSSFTALELHKKFGVRQEFVDGLLTGYSERAASPRLLDWLSFNVPFALAQGSEKARSEFIIAPVLSELSRESGGAVTVFSGIDFDVDAANGLNGVCDFLVSHSSYQSVLEAPVLVAVEAKQEDFKKGLSQCAAEMIAARIFNEREGHPMKEIYGCVTTGDVWRFLILRDNQILMETASFDVRHDLPRILGILWGMAHNEQ